MALENEDKDANNSGVGSQVEPKSMEVARVTAKLPPLWKNRIQIWFIQVESNFQLAGITCDLTMYNHVVAAIDPDTLSAVSDILISPPKENKYETLKKRLIQEYSQSETQKIRQLVSELQLGDEKPSHLLRKMRDLAGSSFNDEKFLKTLWLQRLPSEVQTILSVSSENVEKLATMADKILEVRADSSGPAVLAMRNQTFPKTTQNDEVQSNKTKQDGEISALRLEIAELSKQIERLARPQERGYRGRPFYRSPSRNARRNSRSRAPRDYDGKCYYHFKFGDRAFKCDAPCNFHSTNQQTDNQGNA